MCPEYHCPGGLWGIYFLVVLEAESEIKVLADLVSPEATLPCRHVAFPPCAASLVSLLMRTPLLLD